MLLRKLQNSNSVPNPRFCHRILTLRWVFQFPLLFLSLFTFAAFLMTSPLTGSQAHIESSSSQSLSDQEVVIVIRGLEPGENIQIRAQTLDDNGLLWTSYGLFQADHLGIIDLSKQSPSEGSYQGVDPLGLLWSMEPPENEKGASFKIKKDSFSVAITAHRGQEHIASQEIIRLRKDPNVKKILIREEGLVGLLFLPPSEKPLPVLITLSGSNGGFGENRAKLLASHGFAVLALGYFGLEGLPSNLQDIPLEYFETAFTWLKNQPAIDSKHVGIYGVSRGAELALILGSWFPESLQAIVAVVPSSVIYGGLSKTPVDAWLYHQSPLAPFAPVPQTDFSGNKGLDSSHPANTLESFLKGMQDQKAYEAATIPVEKIQASLLVISGGDDQMWPSALYASQIEQRLKKHQSSISYQHLHYPKAGHGINIPNLPQPGPVYYHPVSKRWFSMGGTPLEDQYASQDSWKKVISFFQKALIQEES